MAGSRRSRQQADERRARALPWRKWYSLKAWALLREAQLVRDPTCRYCRRAGRSRIATVADHVVPHRGDPHRFWHGDLMSLCEPCHNGEKQAEEAKGFSLAFDAEGWPMDPAHPFNRRSGEDVP